MSTEPTTLVVQPEDVAALKTMAEEEHRQWTEAAADDGCAPSDRAHHAAYRDESAGFLEAILRTPAGQPVEIHVRHPRAWCVAIEDGIGDDYEILLDPSGEEAASWVRLFHVFAAAVDEPAVA